MRISNECVRDILFTIEETADAKHGCHFPGSTNHFQKLAKYDWNTVEYHLRYLSLKKLIFCPNSRFSHTYDLMPAGHEFLANIRDDNNWNKIKGISSSIGFASLKVVSAIAEGVATAAINQQLGLSK